MRARILAIVMTITLSLGMVFVSLALAQGPAEDDEAAREAEAAAAAEAESEETALARAEVTLSVFEPITAPLFVGISRAISPAYVIDPATSDAYPLALGAEIWGSAYDEAGKRVYFNRGTTLFEWPLDGAPTALGVIRGSTSNATLSMYGLAYYNGTLYASRGLSSANDPEGIYTIDPATLKATLLLTYTAGAANVDLGGIDAHPSTGALYGVNDQAGSRGLVRIEPNGALTPIAPYPDDQTDIDGLAISGDRAYLVPDEPGMVYVFDFGTMTYTTPITNPWTTVELFSAGAWIPVRELLPGISLDKTVGTDPATCADTDAIEVDTLGDPVDVVYCYTVRNTGDFTLSLHTLNDSHLGNLLDGFEYVLSPGASVFITETAQLAATTTNTATWTAYNEGPTEVVSATDSATVTVNLLAPAIEVSPTETSVAAGQNTTSKRVLTISNPGGAALEWTLATLGTCYGIEPGWLKFEPLAGTTAPGASTEVTVTFDSTGLAPGNYTHTRCVESNAPGAHFTEVTFNFKVSAYSSLLPIVGGRPLP